MSMLSLTYRLPCWVGSPLLGIPSPTICITLFGLVMASKLNSIRRPSKCVSERWKPSNASFSETETSVWRSEPDLRKTLCVSSAILSTTSPGIFLGWCSPMDLKVSVSPGAMPGSISTSNSVCSWRHFCFEGTSTCWFVRKGPICTCLTSTSLAQPALHFLQRSVGLSAHPRQITFLVMLVLNSAPLYNCSSETLTSPFIAGPFSTFPFFTSSSIFRPAES
mmetsp:Transcript_124910/g.400115  ORF Transcript_124910/g.400115 Transcript_124910/m.400115 type:complete len:221 (-) Transcript_124910:885-1547(-)